MRGCGPRLARDKQALPSTWRLLLGAPGATIGIEPYENVWFGIAAETRSYLAFLGERGAHSLLRPALSTTIAF